MTLLMKHDELVRRLLAAIISTPIEAVAKIRYQLPGPLGGLGMRTTTLRSPPAYLANYTINGPVAEIIARKMGKELVQPQAVKNNLAACRDQLAKLGIKIQSKEVVTYDALVKAMLVTSPWMIGHEMNEFDKACSGRGLLSTIMNRVELLQASMYSSGNPNLTEHARALWQSAGGPGVGKFWTEIPGAGNLIDNTHFIVMTAARLDTLTVMDGSQCHIRQAKPTTDGGPRVPRHQQGERRCNAALRNPIEHPYLCNKGNARLRPHDSMKVKLAAELIALHVYADIERHVPSMYKINEKGNIEEAILDVVVSYQGEAGMEAIDITIGCPFHEAAQTPPGPASSACRARAKAKTNKYGVRVFPLAFETFGRLHYDSVESLRQMSAKVARSNNGVTASGVGLATGPQVYSKLRRALEQTLLYEQADTFLRSIGFVVSQANNPNRTRAATPSRREASLTPPTPVGLYLHQMGTATAQPEPIDENGQAFTDIRTLSGLIERGEVADIPGDNYIPPTMADYIDSTGADVANNAVFNYMSQAMAQQDVFEENAEMNEEIVQPTQVVPTLVENQTTTVDGATGSNTGNAMEVDETETGLVENAAERPSLDHQLPDTRDSLEENEFDEAAFEEWCAREARQFYPFPPEPPFMELTEVREFEERDNTIVENRSDAQIGPSFDPRHIPGVRSVEQWPAPLPPGLQSTSLPSDRVASECRR